MWLGAWPLCPLDPPLCKPISELRSVTCRMVSHRVRSIKHSMQGAHITSTTTNTTFIHITATIITTTTANTTTKSITIGLLLLLLLLLVLLRQLQQRHLTGRWETCYCKAPDPVAYLSVDRSCQKQTGLRSRNLSTSRHRYSIGRKSVEPGQMSSRL